MAFSVLPLDALDTLDALGCLEIGIKLGKVDGIELGKELGKSLGKELGTKLGKKLGIELGTVLGDVVMTEAQLILSSLYFLFKLFLFPCISLYFPFISLYLSFVTPSETASARAEDITNARRT